MSFRVEVQCNEWAGVLHSGWRPAAAGTLNQTSMSDEEASTFPTEDDALQFVTDFVIPEDPDSWRIVEV